MNGSVSDSNIKYNPTAVSELYNYDILRKNFPFDSIMDKKKKEFDEVSLERIEKTIESLLKLKELYLFLYKNPEMWNFREKNREYLNNIIDTLETLISIRDIKKEKLF